MGSPSGRVPERAPERFLVATEACGGGTPDLSSVLEVLGYVGIYGCKGYVGEASGGPRGRGRAPHPRGPVEAPLTWILLPVYLLFSKNMFRGVSGHSENFCFCT